MPSRIRVKMCGMTNENDITYAASLGVDAIGLIFVKDSPRFVSIPHAKTFLVNRPLFVDTVAVVVNPTAILVKTILNELPISYLQFHGEETPAFCNQFGKPYIKAISASSSAVIKEAMIAYQTATALLLDTPSLKRGGTGRCFDWANIPAERHLPIILAGGLHALNVKEAIAACNPYAIDVCTGVEQSPGIKDYDKMDALIKCVR